jgi:hypothetical protein
MDPAPTCHSWLSDMNPSRRPLVTHFPYLWEISSEPATGEGNEQVSSTEQVGDYHGLHCNYDPAATVTWAVAVEVPMANVG